MQRFRTTSRQRNVLHHLLKKLTAKPWFMGAILVGSLASDGGDELSDIDLLAVVREFDEAWKERRTLGDVADLAQWDAPRGDTPVGVHKWITRDLVLVECLLGEAGSFRLAEPYKVVAGEATLADRLPRRQRLTRADVTASPPDEPIERLYDEFKASVRGHRRTT